MIKETTDKIASWATKNAPTIFIAVGVVGVVATAVAAGKASIKAKEALDKMPEDADIKEKAKVVAPIMAKPFLIGSATIFFILKGDRMHAHRAAKLAICCAASSKALDEFETKAIETVGAGKVKKIKDSIAEDTVNANPPSDDLIIEGDGKILCLDKWSGKYFRAKPEDVDRALNYINHILNEENYVCLNEWYDQLKLIGTENGDYIGWNRDEDGLVELEQPWSQSCVLYKDTYPVRVLAFTVKPREYFDSAC